MDDPMLRTGKKQRKSKTAARTDAVRAALLKGAKIARPDFAGRCSGAQRHARAPLHQDPQPAAAAVIPAAQPPRKALRHPAAAAAHTLRRAGTALFAFFDALSAQLCNAARQGKSTALQCAARAAHAAQPPRKALCHFAAATVHTLRRAGTALFALFAALPAQLCAAVRQLPHAVRAGVCAWLRKWAVCVRLPDYSYYINGPDTLPAPLSHEEERVVFAGLARGDPRCRDLLIVHNLRLVVYIAKKFETNSATLEDLISIGTIGLIKAVNTFAPDRNIKLATYASRCIENEILMYLRKSSNRRQESSIDEPLNTDGDGNELLLSDVLGTAEDDVGAELEDTAERSMLLEAVDHLSSREKQIMQLRFGLAGFTEHTQKEVADLIGISQSYISRLEKRIIRRLRTDLERIG